MVVVGEPVAGKMLFLLCFLYIVLFFNRIIFFFLLIK